MYKKTVMASSLLLAFGASGSVYATDTISFDPDGGAAGNGDTQVGAFDWAVGSSLADGAIPASVDGSFQLYSHGALQGFQDTNGNPTGAPTGLNSAFEITFILGVGETVDSASSTTTLVNNNGAPGGGDDIFEVEGTILLSGANGNFENFFEIYYDDLTDATGVKSDALSGLGYGDGTVIGSGTVNLAGLSGNFTSTFRFVDSNDNGVFDAGEPFSTPSLLDSFGPDNWAGQLTVEGEGATDLNVDLGFQDNAFFKSTVTALVMDLFFNTSNVLPFSQTNPSQSFDTAGGGTIDLTGGGIALGDMNGLNGPDLLLQTDSNSSFQTTEIPEPGVLALLGLGLSGLGLIGGRRRRSRK